MSMNIDLTTNNTVYNPIGPQGQWIGHRFGQRSYPFAELDYSLLLPYLENTTDLCFLNSCYGDSLCYSDIKRLIKTNRPFMIHSYANIKDDDLFNLIKESPSTVVIKLSGLFDLTNKVYLNANWDNIYNNIQILKNKALIEFELFEHNLHQIPHLLDICSKYDIKLKIKAGTELNKLTTNNQTKGYSSIIDCYGNWMYDVISLPSLTDDFVSANQLNVDYDINNKMPLVKTTQGYLTLRTFVKPIEGKSILSHPSIFKIQTIPSERPITNPSITVTGHVLPNDYIGKIFSNMLCSDWKINYKEVQNNPNSYLMDLVRIVNQINNIDLAKIHYSNDPASVLQYLRDSNI